MISSKLARFTKDAAAAFAAIAIAIVLALALTATASAACGKPAGPSAGQAQRAVIALQNPDRTGPAYYWHDSATYALLYFRPEDLVSRLEGLLAKESLAPALLDNMKVDLPLKESTDLFRYTLIDQRFDSLVNVVIADLMKEGRVMFDQWMLDERSRTIVMVSRAEAGGEASRWFCTSKDDVLFKIGAAVD
ncbi:MAG: hypothetical protein K0Q92_2678 [Steroidobacteraceae bacterium]|nr:hypothetical protein [Steroidobacteraceae bacterium]